MRDIFYKNEAFIYGGQVTKKPDFPVIGTYDLQPRRSYKMISINCLQFKGGDNLNTVNFYLKYHSVLIFHEINLSNMQKYTLLYLLMWSYGAYHIIPYHDSYGPYDMDHVIWTM